MKKFFTVLVTLLLSLTLLMTPYKVQCAEDKSSKETCFSKSQVDLKMSERKLWSDHVLWTRNFIISDLASLEDKDAVLQRLLKNQDDIGNAIKPYYGEDAGNNLSKLLREHITIAGQVVDAAKSGNKKDLEKYNKDWYENADKISEFLSSANPNWSNKDLKDMLYKHLQLTTDEVLARLNKDWKADIAAYDKGENHMLMFADILSNGIMKQFPEKFK